MHKVAGFPSIVPPSSPRDAGSKGVFFKKEEKEYCLGEKLRFWN